MSGPPRDPIWFCFRQPNGTPCSATPMLCPCRTLLPPTSPCLQADLGRPIPSRTSPALSPTHTWHNDDLAHDFSRVLAMSQVVWVHHLQLAPHHFRRSLTKRRSTQHWMFRLKTSCRSSLWLGNPCPWLQPPDDRPAVTPRGHASPAVTPAPRHAHGFQVPGRFHL